MTLFTKPKTDASLDGLTVFDVHKLKSIFKGSAVNEARGEEIIVDWVIDNNEDDVMRFSKLDMERMKANSGDLVYVQDARWWLGGLKSAHSIYGTPHDENGVVYINSTHLDHGQFLKGLKLKAEKEM